MIKESEEKREGEIQIGVFLHSIRELLCGDIMRLGHGSLPLLQRAKGPETRLRGILTSYHYVHYLLILSPLFETKLLNLFPPHHVCFCSRVSVANMFNGMGRTIHPQVNVISFYSKEWMINKSSHGRSSNGEGIQGVKDEESSAWLHEDAKDIAWDML